MPATTTKKHPIRGFLYGIPFGLGLAMIAIGQKWAALGTWPPVILLIVGIVVSMAWGTFGPAKAPKGPEPGTASPDPSPPADASAPEDDLEAPAAEAADAAAGGDQALDESE